MATAQDLITSLTDPEDVEVYPPADASGIYPLPAVRTPSESDLLVHFLLDAERGRLATGSSTTPYDKAAYFINECMWPHPHYISHPRSRFGWE